MPIHPYFPPHKLELRAREKFDQLISELVGSRITDEQAREKHLVDFSRSVSKDGFVEVSPQSIRFAADELSLVLKEIRRLYGK
jgi:hypothetical protein